MPRTTTNPATPSSDVRSEEAPGVRTEAEVVADAQAAADAAADTTPPGATGNPAANADEAKLAAAKEAAEKAAKARAKAEEDSDKLVHYVRESDGTVQSVNPGTPEHGVLAGSGDWSETSRAKARKFEPRRFVRAGGNG
jgi:hypothetical protein